MIELLKVKKALGCSYLKFNTLLGPYINIKDVTIFQHHKSSSAINRQTASFFYKILRTKIHVKPYIESMWEHNFEITSGNINWNNVYTRKIMILKYKKLSEFNFKVLHNILPCGKTVCKWDTPTSMLCLACHEPESTQHMLYDCFRVNEMWKKLSIQIKTTIKWKHIVLGYDSASTKIYALNIITSIIAFSIFREWVISKQKTINNFASVNLWRACIKELSLYMLNFL